MTMARTFTVVIQQDSEGWYVGSIAELPGCHSQAKSQDELLRRLREAIELCLEDEPGESDNSSNFVGIQFMTV